MKSRRLWSTLAVLSLFGLLVVFLLIPDPNEPEPIAEQSSEVPAPKQERNDKLYAMNRDIDATEHLSRAVAAQNLKALLNNSPDADLKQRHAAVREHQQSRVHYEKILWLNREEGKWTEHNGKAQRNWRKEDTITVRKYMNAAKQQVKKGEGYESPKFEVNGVPFFVVGQVSDNGKHAAVVLVNQNVLDKVSDHQKRNLRLIPYPKEGKFEVESVHPDTLKDITVKTGHDNENASHFYENEIVVRFQQDPSARDLEQISKAISCKSTRKLGYSYIFQSDRMLYKDLRGYFSQTWNPVYMEPHYLYLTNEYRHQNTKKSSRTDKQSSTETVNIPNDVLFSRYQWNLPAIEANRGWDLSKGTEDVVIAVVDTGVDLAHSDLSSQLVPGYNVVNPDKAPLDDVGHGTHVAGIIGAVVNNNEGVAGISWYNKIMPVKALDASGSGTTYAVAEGIIWATDHGAKVINLSLGNYADSQFLHDAIKYAYDRDVLLVAASGNDNTERPGYPAAYPEVLAVGATNQDMSRAEYSNFGDYIDIAAPGTNIASTYPGNQYAALSGTSMASPHVAAMAGLIRSLNPDLSNQEVMDLMTSQAVDLGVQGKDKYFGNGQVDIYQSLQAAGHQQAPLQLWPQHTLKRLREELRRWTGNQ